MKNKITIEDHEKLKVLNLLMWLQASLYAADECETIDDFTKNNGEYIDELGAKGNYHTHLKVIKTTTNSQGQQVACGKYIY